MDIEKKKKQLELSRVRLAKEEMEIRIAEREEDIERLRKNIEVQEKTAERLEEELKDL